MLENTTGAFRILGGFLGKLSSNQGFNDNEIFADAVHLDSLNAALGSHYFCAT